MGAMAKWDAIVAETMAVLAVALLWGSSVARQGALAGESQPPKAGLFVDGPRLAKSDAGVEIAFALARPADVTIRVLSSDGKALRHVACGVVGLEKAAEPFAAGALSQKVVWDGKDDAGKAVPLAGCTIQVGAGLQAKFDKFILYQPDGFDLIRGNIHPGREGEFLVCQEVGVHFTTMRVFSREGKFLRGAWPPSLDKPRDVAEKFLSDPKCGADDWSGFRVPACVNHNAWYWFGVRSPETILTTDGCLVGIHGYGSDYTLLWKLTPDGFPATWGWFPSWYKRREDTGFDRKKWHLAPGPDGDFYLADGLRHVVGHFRGSDMSPIASFAALGARKLDAPRCFIGEPGQTGDDDAHFKGPDGIALDRDGRLLVLDGGSVRIYAQDGHFVGKSDGPFPARAAVPDAIVNAGKRKDVLAFPHFIRISPSGRLYVRNCSRAGPFIETDPDGSAFTPRTFPWGVSSAQGYSAFDREGNWYVSVHRGRDEVADTLWKFSSDGRRLRFGDRDELAIEPDVHEIKGVFVAPNGDIYLVVAVSKWRMPKHLSGRFGRFDLKGDEFNLTRVDVYGPDGALKRKGLVRSQGINDVALDRAGNLYVLEATMWHGAQMAQAARRAGWPFAHAKAEAAKLDPATQANKRFSIEGRLLKFAPAGGVLDGEGGAGPLWTHAGVSGLSPWNCGGECFAGQISIDADQRLWVPDTFMYSVKAVDTAGNLILRVGTYGNEDCKGGGGDEVIPGTRIVRSPEIPLARPSGIAVWGDSLFISDMFAHRLVRCRLQYAEQREIAVPN